MLALGLGSYKASSPVMLHGINYAAHLIDLWIVVTLGVYMCLLTGFVYGLFTPWRFFKFKWIIYKWIVTIFCFGSGWIFLGSWETAMLELSKNMTDLNNPAYASVRDDFLCLSILQISLIISMVIVSVIKPWKKR